LSLDGQSLLALLGDCFPNTLVRWQRYPWLVALANQKHVRQSSGKGIVGSVLDVNDVERTWMSFARRDDADATQVVATSDHDEVARVELDVVLDLHGLNVKSDGVVDLDVWIRVANSASVVSCDHGDTLWANKDLLDLAKLVFGFLL